MQTTPIEGIINESEQSVIENVNEHDSKINMNYYLHFLTKHQLERICWIKQKQLFKVKSSWNNRDELAIDAEVKNFIKE